MLLARLFDTGNGIGRRFLLVALAALLVISTLVILPGNAVGADEEGATATTSALPGDEPVSAAAEEATTTTAAPPVEETTTTTSTVVADTAPGTDTTTTSMAVEDDAAVVETTTTPSAVVEEESEVVTTTTVVDEELEVVDEELEMVTVLLEGVPVSVPGDYLESLAPDAGLLAHIPPLENPALANTCGLNIAMVFDRSGSVTPFQTEFKDAAKAFVDALQGTPSTVGLTGFAGIDGVGGNGIGEVRWPMTSIATVDGADLVKVAIDKIPFGGLGDAAGTNWEDGFDVPHALAPPIDVILFLTDGNPTTHNGSADLGFVSDEEDVDAGIFEANIWKVAGTRIVAVGIGDGVTVSDLIAISGPTENSDYFVTDFDTIGDGLEDLAIASCSSTITITKNVDDNNDGHYQISDGSPDWTFEADATQSVGPLTWQQPAGANPVSASVGPDGIVLFDWLLDDLDATTDVDITETVNPDWRYDPQTTCTVKTVEDPTPVAFPVVENGTGDGFGLVAIPRDGDIACEVYNTAVEPEIQIVKTVSPTSVSTPQTVDYTFTIANTGNIELTNVALDDPFLTDEAIDWSTSTDPGTPAGTLSVGEIVNGTGSLAITQADIDDGSSILNTATASSTESPDATDDATVTIIQSPSMTLLKTGTLNDGGDGVDVGDTISYAFTVTNTGNLNLTGITIDDSVAGVNVVGGPIDLAPGASDDSTFTGNYTIIQADIDAGEFENCATAVSAIVDSNESCTTETLPQTPSINLVKDGTLDIAVVPPIDEANPGDLVNYTFVITNTGNVTLTNVTVTDTIGGVTVNGSPIASMAPGDVDSTTYTGTYAITQDDISAGSFFNLATVTGTDPNDAPVTDTDDHTVQPEREFELVLTKTATPLVISTPQTVTYDFVIENAGNTSLTNVQLSDPFLTTGPTCDWGASIDVLTGPDELSPGETVPCTGTYDATQADIDDGSDLLNTATATSDESPDATDDAIVTITQSPSMTLFKDGAFNDESGDGFAQVGETISYTFTVTNTGNVTLLGVTITDPKVTVIGGPTDLDVAEVDSSTFSATYAITQVDIDAGFFENCGIATTGAVDSNDSCTTDALPQNPSIDIDKTGVLDITSGVDPGGPDAGDVIDYSFVITNIGNVTLTNVTLTDLGLTGESCDWSTASSASPEFVLIPGETVDCTGTHTTLQIDFDNGFKINIAATTGTPPIGEDVSATDTETVDLPQNPSVILTKTVTPTLVSAPGLVTYSFTVENDGNVTLTSVTLTDPLPGLVITSGVIASLAPGEINTLGFTAEFFVSQARIDAGLPIFNLATVNTAQGVSDDDDATVAALQEPGVEVLKESVFNDESGDGFAQAGETISYTFTVTNTGNISLTGITLDDLDVTVVGGPIDLAVGATNSVSFTAEHVITQANIDAGSFQNCATANGFEPDGSTPVQSAESCVTDTFEEDASIALVKTGTIPGSDGVGGTITYTFDVTNTGNVTLGNITLADIVGGVTINPPGGTITSLAPGTTDSGTFTGIYDIVQADVDNGTFTNTAEVTGNPPAGGPVTDTDDDTQPLSQSPAIDLIKTGTLGDTNGDGVDSAGDTVNYEFTITNTGDVTLTNVIVEDTVGGVTVVGTPIASLAPGDSDDVAYTGFYVVTQVDIDAGTFTNTATATGTDPTDSPVTDTDDETQTFTAAPLIDLVKDGTLDLGGDGIATPGDIVTYAFTVTNTGNVTLTDVTVTDPLVTVIGGPTIASLAPGASDSATFAAMYAITQGDIDAGSFTNTATTTGTPPVGGPVTDTDDDTQTFDQIPTLTLVKTADPLVFSAPGTVTYSFTITNTGNVTLTNIVLIDDTADSVSGSPIASLVPGASDSSITATYAVDQAAIDIGVDIVNIATATSDEGATDTDTATVTITQTPSIDLVKTGVSDDGGDGVADAGDIVNYTFTVTNTGNVTLTDVTVTDPLVTMVGGPILSMAPGDLDTTAFTASYVLLQSDIDAGTFTNTATVTGTDPGDSPVTDTDDDTQTFDQTPTLTLTKTADPLVFSAPGTVTYSFTITNTGNVTLTNIVLTDDTTDSVSGSPIASLAPGASNSTITATYAIDQAAIDLGDSIVNIATATSADGAEDTDSATVTITRTPSIDLIKTGTLNDTNGDSVDSAGDTITYTFTVENTGNVTLTDVTLADTVGGIGISGGPIATMAPGDVDTATFTATYVVTQGDIDAGRFTNTATVTGTDPGDSPVTDSDDDLQTFTQTPGLVLTKSGSVVDGVDAGDTITYMFTVENTGNVTLIEVDITEDVAGVVVTGGPIPPLALGVTDTDTFTGEYTITQADIDAGTFENCATPDALLPDEEPFIGTQGCTENDLPQDPAISVVKSGTFQDESGDGFADVGETITYAFAVENLGNVTLTNVTLADTVGGVTISGGPIATMAPGDSDVSTFTGSYIITQDDIDAGTFHNVATVTGTPPGENPQVTDDGEADTSLPQNPDIGLFKNGVLSLGPDGVVNPGDVIVYTFTVENTGNVTLFGPKVTDLSVLGLDVTCPWDGNPAYELLPGFVNRVNCTADYEVTQADIDAGEVLNCAMIEATTASEQTVEAEACTTVDEPPEPVVVMLLATLGDTVWNDANSNGIQDNGEEGIAGALVKLTFPDLTMLYMTTDANGKYLFTGLPADQYTVEIVMSSILTRSEDESITTVTTAVLCTITTVTTAVLCTIGLIALALLLAGLAAVNVTTRKRGEEGDLAV